MKQCAKIAWSELNATGPAGIPYQFHFVDGYSYPPFPPVRANVLDPKETFFFIFLKSFFLMYTVHFRSVGSVRSDFFSAHYSHFALFDIKMRMRIGP